MLIKEIAEQNPEWSRVVVAESWLAAFAKETSHDDVSAEFGFDVDAEGEYTISEDEAAKVWAHDWPNGL